MTSLTWFTFLFCRMIVNTLSNLLIFNFEAITWDYTLPPERPEGLGSVSTFAKAPPRKYSRAYVRAQKLMRADTKDSLPSRPPSRAALQSSENLNNVSVGEDFSKRIVSAPPRMRHQASTVSSIEEHIQRIFSARHCRLNRPQSSPAKTSLRNCSARLDVAPTEADSDLKGSMLITQVRQTYPRPPPLPDNRRPHVITRGRSAPAYRTQTLPADRRGWTTSAAEQLRYPENKIMVSAARAREKVARQRPHSAQVQSSKEAICLNPVKSLSCLNLRTFSNQLQYEEKLKESGQGNKQQRKRHQRSASSKELHRSVSCVPCVRWRQALGNTCNVQLVYPDATIKSGKKIAVTSSTWMGHKDLPSQCGVLLSEGLHIIHFHVTFRNLKTNRTLLERAWRFTFCLKAVEV